MPKIREKSVLQVAQKIVNTPRRQTPVQKPKQRKIKMSPMKKKCSVSIGTKKMMILKKVFARRKPHPRSPSKDTKQLLATGKSPNCFSFKSEFLHTPYVLLKPLLLKEDAYDAVSRMLHLSHDDVQERMIQIKVGKKRKYPKRDGSYLDRHYEDLLRKQQEFLTDNEAIDDTDSTFESETAKNSGPTTVIRQNSDGSVYIRVHDLIICEYSPHVRVNMMTKEMVQSFLAPASKPNFNVNPFYQKLATVTIKSIREKNLMIKEEKLSPLKFESEQ